MKKILLLLFSISLLSVTAVGNAKSIRIGTEGAYPPWNNLNSAGDNSNLQRLLLIQDAQKLSGATLQQGYERA